MDEHDTAPLPGCPMWCRSIHADPTTERYHSTDLGGVLGEHVIVVQDDTTPIPMVALVDLDAPEHRMSADAARLHACRALMAAGIVDRYTFPLAADDIVRTLRELLEQREVPS